MRVAPPSRRKALSCSSAQMRELERKTSSRTDFAAVAQRQHEQPGAAVLAAFGIAHHGAGAVINLGLLAGRGDDHRAGFGGLVAAQLAHEALDALIAAGETVLGHQILPDGHGIAAAAEPQFDGFPVWLAGAGPRTHERAARHFVWLLAPLPRQSR